MAVTPTFVLTLKDLRSRLRLSGIPEKGDAFALFEDGVRVARTAFYRRLTHSRIAAIQAMARSDDPTTDDEYLRALAEEAEIKLVRKELVMTMPTLFMDSSNRGVEEWDNEAPFRGTSNFDRQKLADSLQSEISEIMELLEGSDTAGSETSIQASTIEPEVTPTLLGRSIWL